MPIDLVAISGRKKDKLIQFAKMLDKVPKSKLKFPMLASQKLDGVYCLALKTSEGVTIYSRTGEIYTSMKHIEQALDSCLEINDIVIFEGYNPELSQEVISGYARDTKQQHIELEAYCHTYITLDEFIGKKQVSYVKNFEILRNKIVDKYLAKDGLYPHCLWFIDQLTINNLDEAMRMANHIWSTGGEGVILRNPGSPYMGGKRNEHLIKIKQEMTVDLKVIAVYPGEPGGKYSGCLGGVTCQYANGKVLDVGGGFSDEQRVTFWNDPSLIIGKVIEVKAMKESAKGVLREPRCKCIRYDKTEGDY